MLFSGDDYYDDDITSGINYAFSDAIYAEAAREVFGDDINVTQLCDEELDYLAWYLYGQDVD